MAVNAEKSDIGIVALSLQPLVQAMTSCVSSSDGGSLNSPGPVDVMEFQTTGAVSAVLTAIAVHLQCVLAQLTTTFCVLVSTTAPDFTRPINVIGAKVIALDGGIVAVAAESFGSLLMILLERFFRVLRSAFVAPDGAISGRNSAENAESKGFSVVVGGVIAHAT